MSWKDRAKKVDVPPSESQELPEWKAKARKVEEKRAASAIESEEAHKALAERAGEFFTPPKAEHVAISLGQGLTLSNLDEVAGGLSAAYKKATGDKKPIEELYRETRDILRGKTEEARSESPLTSFIFETIGSAPYGSGGYLRRAATGAAIGAGEAEKTEDIPVMATLGGVIGVGSKAVEDIAGSAVKEPNILRARYSGAGTEEFKRQGFLGDPEKSAEYLHKLGFFSGGEAKFDPVSMKFIKTKGGKMSFPSRREALKRANNAIDTLSKNIEEKLSKAVPSDIIIEGIPQKGTYSKFDFMEEEQLTDALNSMLEGVYDQKGAEKTVNSVLEKFYGDIGKNKTLPELQKIKQNLMASIAEGYKKQDPDLVEINTKKLLANRLKNFINDELGPDGAEVAKANEIMHNLFNVKETLSKKVAESKAGGKQTSIPAFGQLAYKLQRGAEIMGGGEKGLLGRAATGEAIGKIPQYIKRPARMAPMQAIGASREPQSIPEELIRTPLPRDSERVIQNRDFVLAKAAQQAPEMFDQLKDVLDNDPESISELMPSLVQMAPFLFERDKYNRVDGKILNPEDKVRATNDTMNRDDLSNHDKIMMINELNKTGVFHDR